MVTTMYKALKIIQIFVWSIVAIVIIGILGYSIKHGAGFINLNVFNADLGEVAMVKEEAVKLETNINKLSVDCDSYDIIIKESDTDELKVVQYAPERTDDSELFNITYNYKGDNNSIAITQNDKMKIWIFGFISLSNSHRMEISIPTGYEQELVISTKSGDICVDRDLKSTNFEVNVLSGDISSKNITASTVDITTKSGDINMGETFTDSYSINTISGSISISKLTGKGDIRVTSGDIGINEIDGEEVNISTVSGDVFIRAMKGGGSIKTTSGDISVSGLDMTGDLLLSCQSGDIDVKLVEDAAVKINAKSVSGDVRSNFGLDFNDSHSKADGETSEGATLNLKITTTSGEISVY